MKKEAKKKDMTSTERGLALRKTHFTLGEGQSTPFNPNLIESLNTSEYGKVYRSFSNSQGNGLGLKAMKKGYHIQTHFHLGGARPGQDFSRMSDIHYPSYKN